MADAKKMRSEASTSGGGGRGESVVGDVGRRKSTCGYCKSGARTSVSHGLWAHSLTVDDYQALLDRGWRRSGCFLYKPDMEKTCCPSYTIRLKAADFVPSKEQVRVSKKMQRFLNRTLDVTTTGKSANELNSAAASSSGDNCEKKSATVDSSKVDGKDKDKTGQSVHFLSDQIDKTVELCVESGELPANIQLPKASVKQVTPAKRKLQAENSEELMFSCNVAFQIVATIRRLKKEVEHVKSVEHGLGGNKDAVSDLSPQKTAEILVSHLKPLAQSHGLSVRACNGHINFYSAIEKADLVEVGRSTGSKTPLSDADANKRTLKKNTEGGSQERRIELRLNKSSFDYEEYCLYRKYQLRVHNDTPEHVTESSYKRFLVDTPLVYVPPNGDGSVPPCGFGSFHQQYVVDGKLIAVGVIDILPKCLSSKYLFWDPDYAFLSLGKYSALEEIKCVQVNQVHCPMLQYYYLGYYIHSCSKMRYKAAYRPSELLCPLRYEWVPYDIAKPLLDRKKYMVLSDHATLQNEDSSLLKVSDGHMEEQQNELDQETTDDVGMHDDEMTELDSDSSDVESDSEVGASTTVVLDDADLDNVLIGIRGLRLRYKDLKHAFDPSQRKFLETQLERYAIAVGTELSGQMVYTAG
ncbi:arginyl-tRNA--protein transferase 2-like [Salvia splendens]|uniref:arginyl-tRNA--protein transferase 2-like n=1 Tax=Salvia splendens TaxID=180675 RepID=UPI001C28108A|nr:arginyl-tRNA--protein transferase 2-like [Salvia splendens]